MKEEQTITLSDIEAKSIEYAELFDDEYQSEVYRHYCSGAEWVYDEPSRVIANLRYDLHIARNGDPCKLPEGQIDEELPFHKFLTDEEEENLFKEMKFKKITKESYDGK